MSWLPEPLPPDTVQAVRRGEARMVAAIVSAVSAENPVYAEVLGDPAGLGIRLGIESAIGSFLDAVASGGPPAPQTDELWRRLGEAEFQAGRPLDALRTAFRTGARAAWRAAAEVAAEVGIGTQAVVGLAEGIFVYTDALAADVTEGYLRAQSDEAGERERRRRRLAALLLDPAGVDAATLERAAVQARWSPPRRLAVLAVSEGAALPLARRLADDALAGGDWVVLADPDGPGRADALAHALAAVDTPAALGPAVRPLHAARSLRWGRRALELVAYGRLPDHRPTRVDDHLTHLALHADPELAEHIVERRLGPLAALPVRERERLLDTLREWLAHQRHTPDVAAALHVHPQTVRYRLARLRDLLGDSLSEPERRLELELALRAR